MSSSKILTPVPYTCRLGKYMEISPVVPQGDKPLELGIKEEKH